MVSIIQRLKKHQSEGRDHVKFEEDIAEAMRKLGYSVTHIGGADEPDLVVRSPRTGRKLLIDGKATSRERLSSRQIDWAAIDRYMDAYDPDAFWVVGKDFPGGNTEKEARKRGVKLVRTDALCRLVEYHTKFPYTEETLENLLFEYDSTHLEEGDIVPPWDEDIVKAGEFVLKKLRNLIDKGETKTTIEELRIAGKLSREDISEENLEKMIDLLAEPIRLVEKIGDREIGIGDFEKWQEKVVLLHQIVSGEGPAPVEKREKTVAGDWEHIEKGVFVHRKRECKIDVDPPKGRIGKEVEKQLAERHLWTQNINSFVHQLRKRARIV